MILFKLGLFLSPKIQIILYIKIQFKIFKLNCVMFSWLNINFFIKISIQR